MSRLIRFLGVAAVLVAASTASAQNPPVRTPPVRNPQRNPAQTPPPPAAPVVPATHNPRWVACYDVSIADATGALRAYGTFDLDSIAPARGITGHRLSTVVGGTRLMRAGWQDAPGDSLRLTAAYIDAGFGITLGTTAGDSLRGYVKGSGMGVADTAAKTPAVARRRAAGCASRMPTPAVRLGLATLTSDYATLTTHPPLIQPSWIIADSMSVKVPKGKPYLRNTLLLRFRGGGEMQRHAIVQSLGGIVVGSILPPREDRDNMLDFVLVVYVEDGATLADLQRLASRATWSPIVRAIGPYYRSR